MKKIIKRLVLATMIVMNANNISARVIDDSAVAHVVTEMSTIGVDNAMLQRGVSQVAALWTEDVGNV